MNITVEFVGTIDTGPYKQEESFSPEEGASVGDFLKKLHFQPSHLKYIQVVRNGKRASHNSELKDGDHLELMLMVGGG